MRRLTILTPSNESLGWLDFGKYDIFACSQNLGSQSFLLEDKRLAMKFVAGAYEEVVILDSDFPSERETYKIR